MKRKIYDQLVSWKQDGAGRTALLIDGARRVGKSYVAEEFAKAEYKSYLLIDFNRVGDEVKRPVSALSERSGHPVHVSVRLLQC